MVTDQGTGRRITRQTAERERTCSSCGQKFKNERGVKIHQGKTRCKDRQHQRQGVIAFARTANKTQEEQTQEAHHSGQHLQYEDDCLATNGEEQEENDTQLTAIAEEEINEVNHEETAPTEQADQRENRKPRLNLPAMKDKRWAILDDQLDTILETTLRGDASSKVQKMTEIVFEHCKDVFGEDQKEKPKQKKSGPSRRQRVLAELRREQRSITVKWKQASDAEKKGLKDLKDELHKQILQHRQAENLRKKQKEKRRTD